MRAVWIAPPPNTIKLLFPAKEDLKLGLSFKRTLTITAHQYFLPGSTGEVHGSENRIKYKENKIHLLIDNGQGRWVYESKASFF